MSEEVSSEALPLETEGSPFEREPSEKVTEEIPVQITVHNKEDCRRLYESIFIKKKRIIGNYHKIWMKKILKLIFQNYIILDKCMGRIYLRK